MKNINNFISNRVFEYRTKGSKNNNKGPETLQQASGKPAEKNGSEGLFGINEPVDNTASKVDIDKEHLTKNMRNLLLKFKTKEDFFIQGRAGWGKTDIVEDLAKRFGLEVNTVYLDKAVATDLGGIPAPEKDEDGDGYQEMLMPKWAHIMKKNKDKKFLLFFDEMNQATPDVMNALMPIVLKHEICSVKFDNFFVGAAGNFESENAGGVNELPLPLKSRFKPIIIWETGTPETWKAAFDHMRKKWEEKLGKKLIDKFEECKDLFENPREIEHKIFKFIYNLKQDGDFDYFDPEDYLTRLEGLVKPDLDRAEQDKLRKLAEFTHAMDM